MPTIKILNRDYQIACGPGEEEKLLRLAGLLNEKLLENSKNFRGANENMLFLLTALTLEDQLEELKLQNQKFTKENAQLKELQDDSLDEKLDGIYNFIISLKNKLTEK